VFLILLTLELSAVTETRGIHSGKEQPAPKPPVNISEVCYVFSLAIFPNLYFSCSLAHVPLLSSMASRGRGRYRLSLTMLPRDLASSAVYDHFLINNSDILLS